ncbi:MAG: hypothetical protein RL768_928 [Nitrospirota bacterium]
MSLSDMAPLRMRYQIQLLVEFWSWREELNLQPAVYKTAALPLSYASQL